MSLNYKDYLAIDKLPQMWCSGCGNGIILRAVAEALAELGIPPHKTVVSTGIGCWGKADDYMKTHAFHGTHGRALAFATGIKLGNPELTVIALMGDGDAVTIGGNHFIHAARRNIDLVAIIANNYNYGMTGGQYSATTPFESRTTTSPKGDPETGFDVCALAGAAGANYVARTTCYHVGAIKRHIIEAVNKKGFSVVEVASACPTYFGRYNGQGDAVKMMEYFRTRAVAKSRYARMSEEEKKGHFPVGVFVDRSREDFLTAYKRLNQM